MVRNAACFIIVFLCTRVFAAERLEIPVVQDNSIVMVDGEWDVNAGDSGRIRIKGNQHIVAMSFDLTAIRGKSIKRAELVCQADAEQIAGVSISTIASPWNESTSTGLSAGLEDVVDWGYEGARFPAVSGGNSHTLVHHLSGKSQDGEYRWEIPVDMVYAMASGIAYGLAIHEHDADYGRNPTIYSREQSNKKPRLIVEITDTVDAQPLPPRPIGLKAIDAMSAQLELLSPDTGFAYEIVVDDFPLARHNIPLVAPGQKQTIYLRDLPDSVKDPGTHTVTVTTLNRTGQRSSPSTIQGILFQSTPPPFPVTSRFVANPAPVDGVSVVPITDKYDQAGEPVGPLPDDYRKQNAIFDGNQIRLTAAAGEVIGFQALLRGEAPVTVELNWNDAKWRTDLFEALYVPVGGRSIPDPLVPLDGVLSLQKSSDTSVFADIYIPFDAKPSDYSGLLSISDGRSVPVTVTVLPFALPQKASFRCEMNSYGLPDRVEEFYALQQIAYDHRVHANILHYSHNTAAPGSRKSNLDMRLLSGRRMDNKRYDAIEPGAQTAYWDDFVEAFGPYLDGSYFKYGHRGPIPAPGFYLTFHESWPLHCREFFNGNPDAYLAFHENPVYEQTYVNILKDFLRLAKSQGWTDTGFQVYFNNKGSLNELKKSPWILDEPSSYWDYRALQFYGELTDRAKQGEDEVTLDYRIDISRPEYCRGQLSAPNDSRNDLWVVSSDAFKHYRRLVTDRIDQDGLKVWVYGTSNPVGETNRNLLAWALDAWQYGATGIVPWQTVDKTGTALSKPDQLGLFIFTNDAQGNTRIHHSSRLKAYREAEQLIEYLVLLQQRKNWTKSQMRAFIQQYITLSSDVRKKNDDEAGTAEYSPTDLINMEDLRAAAITLLR